MAISWEESSQITAGLILSGRIAKHSVQSDSFLSPYDKLIKEFQAGKEKEELIISVGLEAVHTCLQSIEQMNGTKEADWPQILQTTSMYWDAGNKLGKFSEKLKRGEPIDWAMLNYYAKLAQQNQGKDFTPLSEVTESGVIYVKTGWKPWDEHLCGIPQVGLVVIGGMSYSGKTWSWIKLSSEFAKEHPDKNVAFFSLEMTLPELKERYDTGKLHIDVQRRLLLCPHPMNVESVIAKAACIENLGLVGIDYADLLVEDETNESAMTKIYRVLALGSKELNCPIILYAQLNGATGKLPRPQNLRWTRLAEAIGWSVIMTFNPNTDWRGGIVTETKLPKNKNCAYLLAYKMKGGFRNHMDDSPGAIEMPYRPNLGFGDNSRWYKINDDD
jgi:hypothetical protein